MQGFLGRLVGHPFTRPTAVDNLASHAITDLPAPEAWLIHQLHLYAEMLRLIPLHAPSSCAGPGKTVQGRCLHRPADDAFEVRVAIGGARGGARGEGKTVPECSLKSQERA